MSSMYQNIDCIDADFYDQGAIVQHFAFGYEYTLAGAPEYTRLYLAYSAAGRGESEHGLF